ncbi:ATP-dependent helicase [Dinghuibacter silviterrae]|uniref:DNA 3'-5' helicase n=1 Tax=Dinghuibacter silviterrae TaxID=1539049 RepID=A0A4R8DPB8_9BACT|nr:ATP-dependent DNA helicase [Dinghuibacter silviterrae]TDW99921.1 DNA helicase-2/ATP-dependent DNA helicase PcrA [Dinghuibacter silviterrae]
MFREEFQKVYHQLNPEQKAAVDKIEGPVMVIAGPGTGKTQILSARIGKILLETDAGPDNILCLTYTDAGAVAMRRRLLGFIGPDAYKVHIFTFHAFCNEIIQANLSLFDKQSMDPVSDLERIEILKKLIDHLPKGNPLKRYRGDVYYEMSNLQGLFSTMKREGWTPAYLEQCIDRHLVDIETDEEFLYKNSRAGKWTKGDKKPAYYTELEKMEKTRAAVREFDRYQEAMRRANRYDFDDMINWVSRAFQDHPNLLADYQERFQYILVDEFQDTSNSQNNLIELLISFWEDPNVFVVGDDDQSIFRFQGANLENMEEFAAKRMRQSLSEMVVVLTRNYRSTQPVLDVAEALIGRNKERLVNKMEGLSKRLVSTHPDRQGGMPSPRLQEYLSARHEMAGIASAIGALLAGGALPRQIAVIYRENRFGEELAQVLQLRKIPFYSRRRLNLLQIPFARNVLTLLRFLDAEVQLPFSGDPYLFEILHFPFYRIDAMEIARMSVAVTERKYKEPYSLRQHLFEKARSVPADLFAPPVNPDIQKVSGFLERAIKEVHSLTLQQLFERVIREGGILSYIIASPEKVWLMRVLTALFDFIKEENQRNQDLNLHTLVETFDLMASNGLPISITQLEGNDQGVNLLTAHGSKGLEFRWVFLAGCNKEFWEGKRTPSRGYTLPNTVFRTVEKGSDLEELRRLFYVALTRAEVFLHLSWARFRPDGKEMEKTVFIEEIREQDPLPIEHEDVPEETLMDLEALRFQEGMAPEIEAVEDAFIKPLLDRFVMNVTALNNYLYCPLQFYYQSLIRIPSGKSEAAEFGVAVHFALRRLFEKMQNSPDKKTFPPREEFLRDFDWWLVRHRESFTREGLARRTEYGHEVLGNYYDMYIGSWATVTLVELNVKAVLGDIPLKGQLDKLEFTGREVNVVDYKTGDPDKAAPKLKPPGERIPDGGDYWRQAVFYKILLDNYPSKNWEVVSTEFEFVEPDAKKQYVRRKVAITPADMATVSDQVRRVWERIQARDFYTGCGKPECHWCNFVKENRLAVALHEVVEEVEPGES